MLNVNRFLNLNMCIDLELQIEYNKQFLLKSLPLLFLIFLLFSISSVVRVSQQLPCKKCHLGLSTKPSERAMLLFQSPKLVLLPAATQRVRYRTLMGVAITITGSCWVWFVGAKKVISYQYILPPKFL